MKTSIRNGFVCIAGLTLAVSVLAQEKKADPAPAAAPVAPAAPTAPVTPPDPAAARERADAVKAEAPSAFMELPAAAITLGARAWEKGPAEEIGDLLLPVYAMPSGLLFLNPRTSFRDEESELNLGGGYRQMLGGSRMIVGVNAYYDRRETEANNTFHQTGLGLEFLSEWVDARANWYIPEDDIKEFSETRAGEGYSYETRTYDWDRPFGEGHAAVQNGVRIDSEIQSRPYTRYVYEEQAMEGFDCEVGVRLPIPVVQDWSDVKLFAGYYAFDNDIASRVEGWKGRLEIRALPALFLDSEVFEDDDLNGSSYYVGARLQAPFDMGAWAAGKNPFAGTLAAFKPARRNAQRPFDYRLTEMVIRDPRVQMTISDPKDVIEYSVQQLVKQTRKPVTDVLSDTLIYVDRDNVSGYEDGSFEHPYSTISEGLSAANGEFKTVYVFDSKNPYDERPVVNGDGIWLIGSGSGLPGHDGKRFATGIYPVLTGGEASVLRDGKKDTEPFGALTVLSDDVVVSGFEFRGTAADALLGFLSPFPLFAFKGNDSFPIDDLLDMGLRNSGLLAIGANNLVVENNLFTGNAVGLLAFMTPEDPFKSSLKIALPQEPTTLTVLDNRFERNIVGLLALGVDEGFLPFKMPPLQFPSLVTVADNEFQDNLLGAGLLKMGGGLTAYLVNNRFNNPTMPLGIAAVAMNVGDTMNAYAIGNTIEGNHTVGLGLIQEGGSLNAYIVDNTIRDCQLSSVFVEANSLDDILNLFEAKSIDVGDVYLMFSGNTISGNGNPIDLAPWLQDGKNDVEPLIKLPDFPAVTFVLTGGNVTMDLEDNGFYSNRGGALAGLARAYQSLSINVSGLTGDSNGGLFQRNDPEFDFVNDFGLDSITDYSVLILGAGKIGTSSSWTDNAFSNSRLLDLVMLAP